jgi:Trypsin-co-occurring domain 1
MPETSSNVAVILPNKTSIWVEATPLKRRGDTNVSLQRSEEPFKLEDVQSAIEGIGELVVNALKHLAPRKVTAEFALEVGLESGKLTALWVKGTGKANLKITLEWGGDDSKAVK